MTCGIFQLVGPKEKLVGEIVASVESLVVIPETVILPVGIVFNITEN
jgi:hypothetical protein